MSTRKLHTILLLIALTSCFIMTTNAQENEEEEEGGSAPTCNVCIYNHNTNDPYDPSQGACYEIQDSGTTTETTPFVGDNEIMITGFRYVGLSGDCGDCTFTAYRSPAQTGMMAVIPGITPYSAVGFCAKSFAITCDFDGDEEEGGGGEEEEGGNNEEEASSNDEEEGSA